MVKASTRAEAICAAGAYRRIVDLFSRVHKLAVEAAYGPPVPNPVRAALHRELSILNSTWKRDGPVIRTGFTNTPGLLIESVSFENAGPLASSV